MKKNVIVVYTMLLFTITPSIAFSQEKNLIGKGVSFETKSIRMKLYKNVTELSQFPEWPEINGVAVPLTRDASLSFHGNYSLKISHSSYQQLKSEWKQVPNNKKTFIFSCYLCADKPEAKMKNNRIELVLFLKIHLSI